MKSGRGDGLQLLREQSFLIFVGVCLLILLLAVARLQLAGHRLYLAKSLRNKVQPVAIPARRGEIFDRAGKPLAVNRLSYALKYFPPTCELKDDPTLADIASFLKKDTSELIDSVKQQQNCLLYTSPSPRDLSTSRMPSSA